MRHLPHRRLPAGRRQAEQPHPVPERWRSRPRPTATPATRAASRPGPTAGFHAQLRRQHRLRHLPQRRLPDAVGKPNNATHASGDRQLRELPQEHRELGRRQGRPQQLHRRHQLRELPQRHHGHRQAGQPHPDGTATASLPQRQPALWTPTKWNHTQVTVTAQCATCHTGGYPPADGRPTNHIPYQTVAVDGRGQLRRLPQGQLHDLGQRPLPQQLLGQHRLRQLPHAAPTSAPWASPTTPPTPAVTGNCESCHKSTATWAGAKVDHSTFTAATNCATCHNGTPHGQAGNHIPTTPTASLPQRQPGAVDADQVEPHPGVGDGAVRELPHRRLPARRRPADQPHPVPDGRVTAAANCDSCHKGSFTTWANGRLHANYSISTGCFSCHTGAYLNAVGKPNNADPRHRHRQLRELPQEHRELGDGDLRALGRPTRWAPAPATPATTAAPPRASRPRTSRSRPARPSATPATSRRPASPPR